MYVFGHFCNFIFFHFFLVFFRSRPSGVQWPKSFTGKNTSKHVNNMFENFWERFWAFWKKWSFFHFSEVFPSFDPPGCTGQFSQQKKPQNKIKTSLDTFKNNFGHFWELKIFSIFFRIFTIFDLQVALVTKKSKKLPQASLDTFGNVFRGFETLKIFPFYWKFSTSRTLQCALKKKLRKKYFKTSLDTLGIVFRDFGTLKFFPFLWIFFSLQGALGRAFSVEKISQNILQQCFWKRFWTILKVSKFFHFSEFFPSVDPPRCTGYICSKKK